MSKPFQRPPLTQKEKERLAENFIEGAARSTPLGLEKGEKEKKEVIFLRVSKSLHDDLERIYKLTGYKKNIFCMQAIIEAVRDKLKQIERDG
jgi:hypothetical protein